MARKQYFTVRLNRVRIKNNREWGAAEVKLLSFITTGNESLPSLAGYQETNSDDEKKTLIQKAATEMLGFREFIEVHHVRDDSILTFGSADAGYSIFTADYIPIDFNWSLVLIERDLDVRTIGSRLEEIVKTDEFDSFSSNLITLIAGAASPQITLAYKIGKYITGEIGKSLANNKDDQVGLFSTSLNRFQHYINGERKKDNVSGVNGNIHVDYTVFGTEYDA